jgi:hypothetical protein
MSSSSPSSPRSALGPADVSDAELVEIVAGSLGLAAADVELLGSTAEPVDYDLAAITTAGRHWVRGTVRTPAGNVPFGFFVKQVQSWSRSPLFVHVPPEFREQAAVMVPWRTEPMVYRSDLADRLPDGLSMARAVAVRELDSLSAAVWLEEVVPVPAAEGLWDVARLAHAAYLLGRLAASPRVAELAAIGEVVRQWTIRDYFDGRLSMAVLPPLRDNETWQHPLVAGAFDPDLRRRLVAAADKTERYVAELERLPYGTSHGDACTNNLLVRAGSDDLVLIDFGFWGPAPLGFDLGQLLLGDVQLGRRGAECLTELEAACTPSYVRGLRDEGAAVEAAAIRRAHALQMLIFSGLSSLPVEHFDLEPTAELHRISAERAAATRFILDLVDETA